MQREQQITTDVLVIGGGMSGIFAAVKAKEKGATVTIVEKNFVGRSGTTVWSNMFTAFNSAWGHDRTAWADYFRGQAECMNNPHWTDIVMDEAFARLEDLESWGVVFPKLCNGAYTPFKAPGVPIEGTVMQKGVNFLPVLRRHALKAGITILDHIMVTDLIKKDGSITGAVGFHTHSGDFYVFSAKAVVTCTGPLGFKSIKHMAVANMTGDAEAMAYRAGAEISGKEFAFSGAAAFTAEKDERARVKISGREINDICDSNVVWSGYLPQIGAYDYFIDAKGYPLNRFTAASAVHEGRGPVLLNLDAVPKPMLDWSDREIQDAGECYRLDRIGANAMNSGIWAGTFRPELNVGGLHGGGSGIAQVDINCATSLPGLYAAGDSYNSRCVGARYPWVGMGQANAAVTGARAGCAAAEYAMASKLKAPDAEEISALKSRVYEPSLRDGGFSPRWVIQQLQNVLFPYYYSIVKHEDRLNAALTTVGFLKSHMGPRIRATDIHELRLAHEARNMILNAEMIIRASLLRRESRGNHYREDYPGRNDNEWLAWIRIKENDGKMELSKEAIPKELLPDLSIPYHLRYPMHYLGEYDQAAQN